MSVVDRLKTACSRDPVRFNITTPYATEFEGRRWAVGTDGHIIVLLPFDGELRADGPKADEVLGAEPPPTHTANVRALKEWAGCPRGHYDVCYDCDDTGCDRCDGSGHIVERCREGWLLVGGLNRILLARVLSFVDASVVRIGLAHRHAPYILRAPDFIAAVMPLRDVEASAPRFTELEPA